MGCSCKNKQKQKRAKLIEERNNPELRRLKEEHIAKLRESVREQLKNFKRLSK